MMEKYEMQRQIGPSICDASGKLSHAEAFGLFMDIASFHAEQIGVGLGAMAQKDLFWLTVKTQVNFIRRPRMLQNVTLETWPEQPDKMRGNRSYIMRCGEDTVLTGKTEWAVINTATHKLVPLEEFIRRSCVLKMGQRHQSLLPGLRIILRIAPMPNIGYAPRILMWAAT